MIDCPPPPAVAVTATYAEHLGRSPSPEALDYWVTIDLEDMVAWIAHSPEAAADGILHDPDETLDRWRCGWVDAGHGVFVPPILLEIRRCESGGDYRAKNRWSSAAGAYQLVQSTARMTARSAGREDLVGWGDDVASSWHPADQDRMAVELYRILDGDVGSTAGWHASRSCWR